jgi:hypothetical protein
VNANGYAAILPRAASSAGWNTNDASKTRLAILGDTRKTFRQRAVVAAPTRLSVGDYSRSSDVPLSCPSGKKRLLRRPDMTHKRLLVADRVRQPPTSGFSWIDRRFLRDFAARLSHDAIVLYFFLAAVSDKHGLSYWRDATVAVRLRMPEQAVVAARDELLTHDLVAYQTPLTQVLSLPVAGRVERGGRGALHGLHVLSEMLSPPPDES